MFEKYFINQNNSLTLPRLTIENACPIWKLATSTENMDLATECLSKMIIDIDKLLSLDIYGNETSETDLVLLLEHEKMRRQNGEHQLRVLALWIDGDRDARIGRFEHLLQYVNVGTISYERYAAITDWECSIVDCRESR